MISIYWPKDKNFILFKKKKRKKERNSFRQQCDYLDACSISFTQKAKEALKSRIPFWIFSYISEQPNRRLAIAHAVQRPLPLIKKSLES